MSSTCFRCGQRIYSVKTLKNNRRLALDVEPTSAGNVVLIVPGRLAVVLNDTDRDLAAARGEVLWRAHFASCPYGKDPR